MRLGQSDDEAKGLRFITGDEALDAREVVRIRGITHGAGIKAGHFFKRKAWLWRDMHLARDAGAITRWREVMRQALRFRAAGTVIPGAAVPHRLLAGVKLCTAGLAHRGGDIGSLENESLRGKPVDVRRLGVLTAVDGEITERAVIGKDEQDVWLCPGRKQRAES